MVEGKEAKTRWEDTGIREKRKWERKIKDNRVNLKGCFVKKKKKIKHEIYASVYLMNEKKKTIK